MRAAKSLSSLCCLVELFVFVSRHAAGAFPFCHPGPPETGGPSIPVMKLSGVDHHGEVTGLCAVCMRRLEITQCALGSRNINEGMHGLWLWFYGYEKIEMYRSVLL